MRYETTIDFEVFNKKKAEVIATALIEEYENKGFDAMAQKVLDIIRVREYDKYCQGYDKGIQEQRQVDNEEIDDFDVRDSF